MKKSTYIEIKKIEIALKNVQFKKKSWLSNIQQYIGRYYNYINIVAV